MATTSQWVYARLAMGMLEKQLQQSGQNNQRGADVVERAEELDRA